MTCDLPLKPLIAGFLSMANRQDRHHRAIETITDGVAALTEGDKPIPEFSWHVTGWTANFRVCGERLDALADGAHRAPGRLAIFRGENAWRRATSFGPAASKSDAPWITYGAREAERLRRPRAG